MHRNQLAADTIYNIQTPLKNIGYCNLQIKQQYIRNVKQDLSMSSSLLILFTLCSSPSLLSQTYTLIKSISFLFCCVYQELSIAKCSFTKRDLTLLADIINYYVHIMCAMYVEISLNLLLFQKR